MGFVSAVYNELTLIGEAAQLDRGYRSLEDPLCNVRSIGRPRCVTPSVASVSRIFDHCKWLEGTLHTSLMHSKRKGESPDIVRERIEQRLEQCKELPRKVEQSLLA